MSNIKTGDIIVFGKLTLKSRSLVKIGQVSLYLSMEQWLCLILLLNGCREVDELYRVL